MTETDSPDLAFEPPEDAPFRCPHCDRAFARADYRDLHLGLAHEGELTEAEREAHAEARSQEEHELRMFRYKALGVLVLIYFGFLMVYAVSLS